MHKLDKKSKTKDEVVYSYFKLESKLSQLGTNQENFPSLDYLFIADAEVDGYVKPNFKIIEGSSPSKNKSKVVLISATGATGKSALAQMLSLNCSLPIFDLAKHPPVAARAITGLIFEEFEYSEASQFINRLHTGEGTMLIDAMDEGRVKVNENTFNAFLDDIANISKKSNGTPFILLGRNSILEHTYLYLLDKEVETSLIQIEPFTKEQAKEFIDNKISEEKFKKDYQEVRDYIVNSLQTFFDSTSNIKSNENSIEYKRFIGYAPVLSAISTLLSERRNYNKLLKHLEQKKPQGVDLIVSIVEYILWREKSQKSDELVINELINKYGEQNISSSKKEKAYSFEEQSSRLIQKETGQKHTNFTVFDNKQIDTEYNEKINIWLEEHPFILDNKFQNIVFESYALAQLMNNPTYEKLALNYLNSKYKPSYLLFLLFDRICEESRTLNHKFIFHLNNSLKEIENPRIKTTLEIETDEKNGKIIGDVEYFIDIVENPYSFRIEMEKNDSINLGKKIGSVFISHPGILTFTGTSAEFNIPTYIECNKISINTPELIFVKDKVPKAPNDCIVFDCEDFIIDYQNINSTEIVNYLSNDKIFIYYKSDLPFPFHNYHKEYDRDNKIDIDLETENKYRILRRIILAFRSHSKGILAKLKVKIESREFIKGEEGEFVYCKLKKDGVIYSTSSHTHMLFINPGKLHENLGINYHDLKAGKITQKILKFLRE